MRIIPFISLIAAMPSFFMMVHKRLYENDSGSLPDDSVLSLLLKAENSFDTLLKNLSLLLGTSVLGMISDPPDAEEKAEKIIGEFKESYDTFLSDFRIFLECLNMRKDTFMNYFGSDWLRIESLKKAFEKPEVDWELLCEKRALICDSSVLKNERKYNSVIFGKLKGFLSSEAGEYGFEPMLLFSEFSERAGSS